MNEIEGGRGSGLPKGREEVAPNLWKLLLSEVSKRGGMYDFTAMFHDKIL